MSHRKILLILFGSSVLGLLLGLILLYPEKIGICQVNDYTCIYPRAFTYGEPLTFGFLPLIVTLLILMLLPDYIFRVWGKFAIFLIPIGVLWIIFTPVDCNELVCFTKEMTTWISSISFAIISFLVI